MLLQFLSSLSCHSHTECNSKHWCANVQTLHPENVQSPVSPDLFRTWLKSSHLGWVYLWQLQRLQNITWAINLSGNDLIQFQTMWSALHCSSLFTHEVHNTTLFQISTVNGIIPQVFRASQRVKVSNLTVSSLTVSMVITVHCITTLYLDAQSLCVNKLIHSNPQSQSVVMCTVPLVLLDCLLPVLNVSMVIEGLLTHYLEALCLLNKSSWISCLPAVMNICTDSVSVTCIRCFYGNCGITIH